MKTRNPRFAFLGIIVNNFLLDLYRNSFIFNEKTFPQIAPSRLVLIPPHDILRLDLKGKWIGSFKVFTINGLGKGASMKNVLHKTRVAFDNRIKMTKIIEDMEDKDCVTKVRKTFVYVLSPAVGEPQTPTEPVIKIQKSFNTKTRDEKFSFRIKGAVYVNHNRRLIKVDYCHALRIHLRWKTKVFSPKKSVTMA